MPNSKPYACLNPSVRPHAHARACASCTCVCANACACAQQRVQLLRCFTCCCGKSCFGWGPSLSVGFGWGPSLSVGWSPSNLTTKLNPSLAAVGRRTAPLGTAALSLVRTELAARSGGALLLVGNTVGFVRSSDESLDPRSLARSTLPTTARSSALGTSRSLSVSLTANLT